MNEFFVYNYVLLAAIIGWCSAQIIKTIIYAVKLKTFRPERLIGSGGMPSSHSSTVCAALVAVGRHDGVDSSTFAIMFILALIVMYDAMGVRRAAGMHAKELNKINKMFENKNFYETFLATMNMPVSQFFEDLDIDENSEKKKRKEFKEFIGHTPLEVLAGMVLGVLIAILLPMV